MEKCIFLFISCFAIVFMNLSTGICQTVTNSSFNGTPTGWYQGDCATTAAETNYTMECYSGIGTCTDYATCGAGCASDYVAEVDNGNTPGLCQSVSGFTAGNTYTLYISLARRFTEFGSGGAPNPMTVDVCVGTSCTSFTRSTSGSWIAPTTSTFTFTANASGSLAVTIIPRSAEYAGPGHNDNYGMVVSYVGFTPTPPLPITLLDFMAVKNGTEVNINWQTETEINNDYFIVEKSKNGIDFIGSESIKGAGNSQSTLNYQTTDHSPYNGISYYRLKQVDYDGTVSYSKIVAVNFNDNKNINVYPNPGTGIFNIQGLGTESEITVHNPLGQTILIKRTFSDSSEIDLRDQLSGVYYIKINNGETSISAKIILNR
jgi:hypothetical protein